MDDLEFHITKPFQQSPDLFIDSMTVQNKYYTVTLFYMGDYAADKAAGKLSKMNASMVCESRHTDILLHYMVGYLYIKFLGLPCIEPDKVDRTIERLRIAKRSAENLQKILDEYLPLCDKPSYEPAEARSPDTVH